MVAIFALTAAVLYGTADFLGGAASRRASALAVLSVTAPAGLAVAVIAALAAGGPIRLAGPGGASPGARQARSRSSPSMPDWPRGR